jgi:hypothetical protein
MIVIIIQIMGHICFNLNIKIIALGDSICQAIVHNDLKALKK